MSRPGQTPSPQFKRSPSMPYGSVRQANAERPAMPRQQAQPRGGGGGGDLRTQAMDWLFGPSERPDEPLTAGAPFGPGPTPSKDVPPNVRRALPLLQQLSTDPDAPQQLRDMVSYLVLRAG